MAVQRRATVASRRQHVTHTHAVSETTGSLTSHEHRDVPRRRAAARSRLEIMHMLFCVCVRASERALNQSKHPERLGVWMSLSQPDYRMLHRVIVELRGIAFS